MATERWWVIRCSKCGMWLQARPAKPYWTKTDEEEEVEVPSGYSWFGGRRWYIGDTLTRIINEYHTEERCKIEQENKRSAE